MSKQRRSSSGPPPGAIKVDMRRVLSEPDYLHNLLGGDATLPVGLRAGDIVGPRTDPAKGPLAGDWCGTFPRKSKRWDSRLP